MSKSSNNQKLWPLQLILHQKQPILRVSRPILRSISQKPNLSSFLPLSNPIQWLQQQLNSRCSRCLLYQRTAFRLFKFHIRRHRSHRRADLQRWSIALHCSCTIRPIWSQISTSTSRVTDMPLDNSLWAESESLEGKEASTYAFREETSYCKMALFKWLCIAISMVSSVRD